MSCWAMCDGCGEEYRKSDGHECLRDFENYSHYLRIENYNLREILNNILAYSQKAGSGSYLVQFDDKFINRIKAVLRHDND